MSDNNETKINWDEIAILAKFSGLNIFYNVWFKKQKITQDEEKILKAIFDKYPLGTHNFNIWLKQRARQLYEKSVEEERKLQIVGVNNG